MLLVSSLEHADQRWLHHNRQHHAVGVAEVGLCSETLHLNLLKVRDYGCDGLIVE